MIDLVAERRRAAMTRRAITGAALILAVIAALVLLGALDTGPADATLWNGY